MKNFLLLSALGVLAVSGVVLYLLNGQVISELVPSKDSSDVRMSPTGMINRDAQPFVSSNPDVSTLRAGGSSYSDSKGLYTFLYPSEYSIDTQDTQYLRLFKTGPTQKGQTEMYDGVIMVFETIELQGQSLESVVDTRIAGATADGTSEIIQPKRAVTLGSYPGFTYETRGLGSATVLVLQKDLQSTQAVGITMLIADPGQIGFQKEVDAILSTLELR